MTTIPAAALRQMIDRVTPHMSNDDTLPVTNSVRIEHSEGFLFAVATDRFTIGISRFAVVNTGETWQVSIPSYQLAAVTAWLGTVSGSVDITTREAGGQARVKLYCGDGSMEFSVDTADNRDFPRWRAILRTALTAEPVAIPVTSYTSQFLKRWEKAGRVLHSFQSGPNKPTIFMSDDGFLGALMPVRNNEVASRAELVEGWLNALIPVAEVHGNSYRLDRKWSDRDGDIWEYVSDRYGEPLMRVVGIDYDDHKLSDLIEQYGPITPVPTEEG